MIPEEVTALLELDEQKAIPSISKNVMLMEKVQQTVQSLPSSHQLLVGGGRNLAHIPDESVHLVITSPPYWNLKQYVKNPTNWEKLQTTSNL